MCACRSTNVSSFASSFYSALVKHSLVDKRVVKLIMSEKITSVDVNFVPNTTELDMFMHNFY